MVIELRVVQFWSEIIILGYSDIHYITYVDLTGPTRTRRNHDFKIRPRAARTNYFKFSFFNRYVNDWKFERSGGGVLLTISQHRRLSTEGMEIQQVERRKKAESRNKNGGARKSTTCRHADR